MQPISPEQEDIHGADSPPHQGMLLYLYFNLQTILSNFIPSVDVNLNRPRSASSGAGKSSAVPNPKEIDEVHILSSFQSFFFT